MSLCLRLNEHAGQCFAQKRGERHVRIFGGEYWLNLGVEDAEFAVTTAISVSTVRHAAEEFVLVVVEMSGVGEDRDGEVLRRTTNPEQSVYIATRDFDTRQRKGVDAQTRQEHMHCVPIGGIRKSRVKTRI